MSHRFLSLLSKVLSLPSKDTGRGVDFGRSQLPHRYVRSSSVVARSGSSMAMTKILYVEDNEDNVYMLVNRLRRHGYELIVAGDGAQGIAWRATTPPRSS